MQPRLTEIWHLLVISSRSLYTMCLGIVASQLYNDLDETMESSDFVINDKFRPIKWKIQAYERRRHIRCSLFHNSRQAAFTVYPIPSRCQNSIGPVLLRKFHTVDDTRFCLIHLYHQSKELCCTHTYKKESYPTL